MDNGLLRLAFIVYGGMNRVDWRTVSIVSVAVDPDDLGRKLLPVLHKQRIQKDLSPEAYGATLVEKCREGLQRVIPFTPNERSFLDRLLDEGSFIYYLAQRNTRNQKDRYFSAVKDVFSLNSDIPTDIVFPTPPPHSTAL